MNSKLVCKTCICARGDRFEAAGGPGGANVNQACDDRWRAPAVGGLQNPPAGGDLNAVPQVENNRKDDDGRYKKKKKK